MVCQDVGLLWRRQRRRGPRRVLGWKAGTLLALGIGAGPPGFGVWGLGFGVWGLGFEVWG